MNMLSSNYRYNVKPIYKNGEHSDFMMRYGYLYGSSGLAKLMAYRELVAAAVTMAGTASYENDLQSLVGLKEEAPAEPEIPLNFKLEKLSGQFIANSSLISGEYLGFFFKKGTSDCSIFDMHLIELH